jgi:hypothetical protein
MPKTKISEFSATPGNNTDIDGINIAEGCAPSGINDAIRELMAQLKDFQAGTAGDSFNGPVGTTTAAAGAFTTLSASSTTTLSGGTANGVAYLNGSKVVTTGSALTFDGTSLTSGGGYKATGSVASLAIDGGTLDYSSTITRLAAGRAGGNYGTFELYVAGASGVTKRFAADYDTTFRWIGSDGTSEQMRLTSTGLGIGTSSPAYKLHVSTTTFGAMGLYRALDVTSVGAAGQLIEIGALNGSTVTPGASIQGVLNNPATSGYLTFQTRSSSTLTERVRIDSSGNVGIGTSSPGTKLTVHAGADGDVGFFRGGSTRQVQIGTSSTAGYINTDNGSAGLEIRTQGTARMFVDNSGNLGLGVTPSAWSGFGKTMEFNNAGCYVGNSGATSMQVGANNYFNGSNYVYSTSNVATRYAQASGQHIWFTAPSGTAGNAITFTQAMTLDASGNLLVGTTSSAQNANDGLKFLPGGAVYVVNNGGTDGFSYYNTTAGAYRFYVQNNGTIAATNTTIAAISDQRLKENIQDLDVGLDKIMALKPRKFDWKAGKGKDIKGDRGWIAQEFEQVFPDMVDQWKDPAPEGEEPYKSVRADLIPVLVKAIQEQQALIQTLTARVAALEA